MGLLAGAVLVAAACGGGSSNSAAKTATNAAALGGMDKLVEAANAEGALNVIALPPDWANYKGVLDAFKAKYPKIKVTDQKSDANSQQEIDAAKANAGTDRAPDVFDLTAAITLANLPMFAPYQTAAFGDVPANLKDSTGLCVSDYAGFMSVGCDAKKVAPPATVADMLKPEYKGMIALNGNPKTAGAGLNGVLMAALANGGSADDISKGVAFFDQLNTAGNLLPVDPTPRDDRLGPDALRHRLGVQQLGPDAEPRRQGHRLEGQRAQRRPADRRVLPPDDQQGRAPSGGRPPVGGVPVHARGPERVAEGLRSPGPPGQDDQGRDDRPGRAGRGRQGRRAPRSS